MGLGAGAQGDEHLVPGGLKDLVDLGVQQGFFELGGHKGQRRGIQSHGFLLFSADGAARR